ncbi:hypothetical protein F5J12DRAFT_797234 [Pisolithus orientalis]|uniref:uncharacterized protein n=1 Tax=Pisolithus orientalis TaxID=936130 RepID=UPI002224A243|nr:uncharacterized protein F5J12DRAFT_797234 [Pisolithus orientalis]KAI6032903.1 hypothetical protein F5J12DRAFT_797234 [Pisolithus orientalis]
MTTPRNDRMYESAGKTRRSPPGGDSQSSGFFQTGQVPSHYSNQYLQSRSSPAKAEHPVSTYSQWPTSATPVSVAQQHSSPLYEHHYDSRYQQAQGYQPFPPRTSPPVPPDSRKLPPLSVPPTTMRDDRWQGGTYGSVGPQLNYGDIRSPTATYPSEYAQYQHQSSYSYPPVPDTRGHPSQLSMHPCHPMSMGMYPPERGLPAQVETHGTSPYSRGPVTNTPLTQEPAAMLSTEEPAIKKKRKRADAAQLKVLNEVYSRTAFPSTEERADLAKKLDMSARSVQIWFQNKRQSMRQTTRQASSSVNTASQHQSFSAPSQGGDASHAPYSGSTSPTAGPTQPYLPRSESRAPGSLDARSSINTRPEGDPRKWSSRY